MIPINLKERKRNGETFFVPESKSDLYLMQHCINKDVGELTEPELEKARYIAASHEWRIFVE